MPSAELRVLVTGGAGFVGANLCLALAARHPDWEVVALDNLKRRGSRAQPAAPARGGVRFVHGDVRAARRPARRLGPSTRSSSARPSRRRSPASTAPPTTSSTRTCVGALQLPRAARAATGRRSSSSRPAASIPSARSTRCAFEEARDALRARARSSRSRAPRRAGSPRTSRSTGARTLYGATKLAAELLRRRVRARRSASARSSTAAA